MFFQNLRKKVRKMRKIAVYEQCLSDRKMMNFYLIFTASTLKISGLFLKFLEKKIFHFLSFLVKIG